MTLFSRPSVIVTRMSYDVKMTSSLNSNFVAVAVLVMIVFLKETDAIQCKECNSYFQGQRGAPCDAPLQKSNCAACLKVVTKVKVRDSGYILGWERVSEVVTRHCAKIGGSPGLRNEGCYNQENNGGYTRRCFCYSDNCNKATQLLRAAAPLWMYAVLSLGLGALLSAR